MPFAPASNIYSNGKASRGSTRFWPGSQSVAGVAGFGEAKRGRHEGEAGLVRLAASAENPLLSECCTRRGLGNGIWAVKFVDSTKDSCPALNSDSFRLGSSPRNKSRLLPPFYAQETGYSVFVALPGLEKHDTAGSETRVERGRPHHLCHHAHGISGTGPAKRGLCPGDYGRGFLAQRGEAGRPAEGRGYLR